MNKFSVFLIVTMLASCGYPTIKNNYAPTNGVSETAYLKSKETKGLVLVATTGERKWGCGSFENAELWSIGFNRLTSNEEMSSEPDLIINNTDQYFMNYAYLLEPGTCALSHINIKVASSIRKVGYILLDRSDLLDKGGTFTVNANEAVYIGHFGLDCVYGPTLWRYYSEDKKAFDEFVSSYVSYYPYLALENVSYRLFSTKEFGHDFKLD